MVEKVARTVSAEDRIAIEDVLGRYLLAVDCGQVDAVIAQFTPDPTIRYGNGETYAGRQALREFAIRAIGDARARSRMHLSRSLFAEHSGPDIVLRSYLMVPDAGQTADRIELITLRYVEDTFRLTDNGWRINERAIFDWRERPSTIGTDL